MKLIFGALNLLNPLLWLRLLGWMAQGFVYWVAGWFRRTSLVIATILLKIPFLKKIPVLKMVFDENFDVAAYFREKDAKNKRVSALRQGKLDQAREDLFPAKKYPWLHRALRVDMNPSPIIDSKLPNGKDTSWMTYRQATDRTVNSSFRDHKVEAITDGCGVFMAFMLYFVVFSFISLNIDTNIGFSGLVNMASDSASGKGLISWDPQFDFAPVVTADTWSTGLPVMAYVTGLLELLVSGITQTLLNPFVYIASASFMVMSYLSMGFSSLQGRIKQAGLAYQVTTKQEQITNRYNAVDRAENQKSLVKSADYNDNVLAKKGFDGGVLLGHSTGQLVARGADPYIHMPEGTPWYMGYEELYGHMGIMGNTGSGKTSLTLKRLLSAIASINNMGMMLIDYKAVLPFELLEQFKKDIPEKIAEKLRIIGTGNVDGTPDYGLNLLEGIRPDILKGLIQSVMEQTEKEAGSDYFDKASYQLLEHAARIAQAWELTKGGNEWAKKTGRTPYNLMTMVDMVERDDIRIEICRDVANAMGAFTASKTKSGYALSTLDRKSLRASLRYMAGTGEATWGGMSDRQKSGVIGTFQTIVSALNSNPVLRERFFEGRIGGKTLSIPQAIENGYIMPVNISSEEDGMAGMFAISLMKTQVFAETSRRQKKFAKEGKNPQIESPFCLMIDEAQNFITAGNISMSDAKVLNTARSTGLSIIYGFQNINSLEKRIGKENTKDIMANLTTKMTLINHDLDTAEYFSKHFGESQRLRTHRDSQFENFWQARRELDLLTPEEFDDATENDERFRAAIYKTHGRPKDLYSMIQKIEKLPDYEPNQDARNYIANMPEGGGIMAAMANKGGGEGGKIAKLNALIAQSNREEDKREHALTTGNEHRPLISVSEVSELPQGHAIVEWRVANHPRKDIVKLLPGIY